MPTIKELVESKLLLAEEVGILKSLGEKKYCNGAGGFKKNYVPWNKGKKMKVKKYMHVERSGGVSKANLYTGSNI